MPRKNGRRKGGNYERKIADLFGKQFKMKFKRTPMSGGWSKETVQGDIVPVGEDVFFALSLECKNVAKFPMEPIKWLVQSIRDTQGTNKIPVVVSHIAQTNSNTVIKLRQNKKSAVVVENPFPRGEEVVMMRLSDFFKVVNKKKLKDKSKWK